VHHIGSTTAARLLAAFGSVEAAFAAIDRGDTQTVRDTVGDRACEQLNTPAMRENVVRNRRLMRMP
jgi:DNA polymerase-1